MCSLCGQSNCLYGENGSPGGESPGPLSAKPVFTNQEVIQQLDSGAFWSTGSSVASTITYGVTSNKSWFPSGYSEYAGWSALNAKQAAAATTAVELWDDLIQPSMVAAANPNTADIRFSNSTTGVSYAHAYYPGATDADTYAYQKAQGSVWFNSSYSSLTDPDVGEYGFMAFMHEIGHTLGLSHPGTYNGGSPTYANDALYAQDTHMYTIMSYFDAENTGADWYASNNWWYYAQTPMVHDVLAIQSIYGADMTTRSGNTTYGFNANAGKDIFDFTQNLNPVLTIWDGGGNDTLDLSGWNTSSQIFLEAGSYSHANSMTYNIAIAFGAVIENAVGGGGGDQITGNGANNTLVGNAGNDVLNGEGGNDHLNGGSGLDTLSGGDGADMLYGYDGNDVVNGNAGADMLFGQRGNDILWGGDGADTGYGGLDDDQLNGGNDNDMLNGEQGDDVIYGDAGNDILAGEDGNDTLNGGSGQDSLYGGAGNDSMGGGTEDDLVVGLGGNDTLHGDAGADILAGADGTDLLFGDAGSDLLFGGADDDTLNGGTDDDLLIGNSGNDTLNGDAGADILAAGDGGDFLYGGAGDDRMWGHDGIDLLDGGDDNDILIGGNHGDSLSGGAGNDALIGGSGNDTLDGGTGDDDMFGGSGDDLFLSSAGTDVLYGEAGDDLFVFTDGNDYDWIIGFTTGAGSEDVIDITDFGFSTFADILSASTDVGANMRIQLDADDYLNLKDLQISDLHIDDFFGVT